MDDAAAEMFLQQQGELLAQMLALRSILRQMPAARRDLAEYARELQAPGATGDMHAITRDALFDAIRQLTRDTRG